MKRLLAACMALLLLALPACGQEPSEDPSVPDPPVTDTPQPPKTETPEEPPAEEALPEAAAVADNRQSGEVAEGVTYDITVPQIAAGSQEAADLINEYYDNLSHKYMDLAGGEVLEQAMQSGLAGTVESEYSVTYNGGHTLSILSSVTASVGERMDTTLYAETFDTATGRLYTAEVLFSSEDYASQLIFCVTDQIAAGNTELLYDDWQAEAASAFNTDAFFLTQEGYGVFYQADTLCDTTVQLVIPYADLAGLCVAPEEDMQ